jgi:hypothetical protein
VTWSESHYLASAPIVVIFTLLFTVCFMKRDGNAGIHRLKNIVRGGVNSDVTRVHYAYKREMLFYTVVLSRACAERIILSRFICYEQIYMKRTIHVPRNEVPAYSLQCGIGT